jgi:hypothetical protein
MIDPDHFNIQPYLAAAEGLIGRPVSFSSSGIRMSGRKNALLVVHSARP